MKKLFGSFYEKELQKTIPVVFKIGKVIKKKGDKLYVKWISYDNSIDSWINKRYCIDKLYKMSQYFPQLYELSIANVKVELDLSDHTTKADSKGATCVDVSNLAAKLNLANLKAEVDKTGVNKLKTVPADLRRPSNIVDNDIQFKNTIQFWQTKSWKKNEDVDKKILNTSTLVKKTIYTQKLQKLKIKYLILLV